MPNISNDEFMSTIQQLTSHGYMKQAHNKGWSFYSVTKSGQNFLATINTRSKLPVSAPTAQLRGRLDDIITEETHSQGTTSIASGDLAFRISEQHFVGEASPLDFNADDESSNFKERSLSFNLISSMPNKPRRSTEQLISPRKL